MVSSACYHLRLYFILHGLSDFQQQCGSVRGCPYRLPSPSSAIGRGSCYCAVKRVRNKEVVLDLLPLVHVCQRKVRSQGVSYELKLLLAVVVSVVDSCDHERSTECVG